MLEEFPTKSLAALSGMTPGITPPLIPKDYEPGQTRLMRPLLLVNERLVPRIEHNPPTGCLELFGDQNASFAKNLQLKPADMVSRTVPRPLREYADVDDKN